MQVSHYSYKGLVAGCDEAGRGCLAGPVFAATVILPANFTHPDLTDSKLVPHAKRGPLMSYIKQHALYYAVAKVSPGEIDQINILNASFKAMHKALRKLAVQPDFILVDGNRFTPYRSIPYACIIKGDRKYASIAAASILAKEHRDRYMKNQAKKYPFYAWENNKGYPTAQHRQAIITHGITSIHRKSFQLYPNNGQKTLF
jgi:ribonuclease HII